jgi:hypothetical protein
MAPNVGTTDRIIRAIVGIVILSLFFIGPKSYWALLGLIPLGSALMGYCFPYKLLGINTCKIKS